MANKKIIFLIVLSVIFLKAQEIDSARIYLQIANPALNKGEERRLLRCRSQRDNRKHNFWHN
ncbi:MAG: hypothetical protein ACPL28_04405 [bacterium]